MAYNTIINTIQWGISSNVVQTIPVHRPYGRTMVRLLWAIWKTFCAISRVHCTGMGGVFFRNPAMPNYGMHIVADEYINAWYWGTTFDVSLAICTWVLCVLFYCGHLRAPGRLMQFNYYSPSGKTSYRQISWSLEGTGFGYCHDFIALKFGRHLGNAAAEVPVKFHSDLKSLRRNIAASRLQEILR